MPQQIVVINGGNAFETHEEFINYLKNKPLSIEKLAQRGWKDRLGDDLGKNYQVLLPKMPNSQNARYSEWVIWFERILDLLDGDTIFIGHSLGGVFLAKYFSENTWSKPVKAIMLVAARYNTPEMHKLVDFVITKPLDNLSKQADKLFIYHSKDDKVVPFEDCDIFAKALPQATVRVFEDRHHFDQPTFPEIVEDIKSI